MLIFAPTSLLKKYCAKEVLILLERMEQRPEDFHEYGSIWRKAVDSTEPHFGSYTVVERILIARANDKMKQNYKRRELLNVILNEAINPTTKETQPVKTRYPYTGVTSPSNLAQYPSALQNVSAEIYK